jgi:hypothetical protein
LGKASKSNSDEHQNRSYPLAPGTTWRLPTYWPCGVPVHRRRDSNLGFRMELENLGGDVKGKGTSGGPMRPKLPMHRPGAHCFVVARKRGNSRGAKGAGLPRRNGVNGETGGTPCSGGRRQPSLGGHEPDESRGSCPDLWEARGAIPRAYPATGNRVTSNRTEGTTRKRSHMPTGRLKPLRLFSTLLPITLKSKLKR